MKHASEQPLWLELKPRNYTPEQLLDHLLILSPPVPVVQIAKSLGVDVFVSEMDEDGVLHMDAANGFAEILVNIKASATRMRFTIAHELGHLMLHEFTGVHRDTNGEYQGSVEWAANNFAAELLMPTWMVRVAVSEAGFDIARLAATFNVSEQAMTYRLKNLGML